MKKIVGKNLCLHFANDLVLHEINLELVLSEFCIISGHTGSGKSVLSKLFSGVLNPSSGMVRWDGLTSPRGRTKTNTKIPLLSIPQEGLFLTARERVGEEIRFGLKSLNLQKDDEEARYQTALEFCGLKGRELSKTHELSHGQKKILAIASALALDPDFLIIDDPFSGLDPSWTKNLVAKLVQLHQSGKGIVLCTNDLDRVLAHADRLVLLKSGRIMADGLPERVLPFLEEHGLKRPQGKRQDMSWLL